VCAVCGREGYIGSSETRRRRRLLLARGGRGVSHYGYIKSKKPRGSDAAIERRRNL